jgi:hypothetical protein
LALLLLFSNNLVGQIVNIPDANFKNALINGMCVNNDFDLIGDSKVDLNNDGEIQVSEALLYDQFFYNRLHHFSHDLHKILPIGNTFKINF